MHVRYMGQLYCEKRHVVGGFLFESHGKLEDIRASGKKICLLSSGPQSFFCEALLAKNGIDVDIVCENFEPVCGRSIRNKNIVSAYDVFRNSGEYHVIVAVNNRYINEVRLELLAYDITEYGVFFINNYYDFHDEGLDGLSDAVMAGINRIAFHPHEDGVLPVSSNVMGGGGSNNLGNANYLLNSTEWSHPAYAWIHQFLMEAKRSVDVLEIGSGFGLLSMVMKQINPDFNLDWISFGEKKEGNWYFEKIAEMFPDHEYNEYFGYIENPGYSIGKKYDAIIMTEVLEHFVVCPVDTLERIGEALKRDGVLFLTTPNWGHLYIYETWKDMKHFHEYGSETEYLKQYKGHSYQYRKEELLEIFDSSGLQVIAYEESVSSNHNFSLRKKR
jgi:2-polyprenyl-3-methyl-5-hydroxy-6-metoxy-1,4-benzoquinol methylase